MGAVANSLQRDEKEDRKERERKREREIESVCVRVRELIKTKSIATL
jgi:hypothetical protein